MSYIGKSPNLGQLYNPDVFSGDGSTTFTLTNSVTSDQSVIVSISGVKQQVSTYSISGFSLVFDTAPPTATNNIEVQYLGSSVDVGTVGNSAIDSAQIASGAVDDSHITAMSASKLTGTITPSNNTVDETKLKDALVADFTEVVVTASDSLLIGDATDGGNTKRDTVQGILDLVPASGITSYISSFSYDQSTTGNVAVTGVGFTPTLLIAHTVQASSPEGSTGFGNAGDEHALRFDHNNTADSLSWSNYIGQILQSGSISSAWTIASYDADGFTYTKSKSGSATGTTKVLYLAIK